MSYKVKKTAAICSYIISFRKWLEQQVGQIIAGTPLHKAVNYALARFEGLMVYTTDGMLEPDDNFLEAQIRPIALDRHNHMFAGSHLDVLFSLGKDKIILSC